MILRSPEYLKTSGSGLEAQLENLLSEYKPSGIPVRLVFFGSDNTNTARTYRIIMQFVRQRFGKQQPVVSYVAQASPEGITLVMESTEVILSPGEDVLFRQWNELPYIIIESYDLKALFISNLKSGISQGSLQDHTQKIFSSLKDLFYYEQMPVDSIIHQWNYIGEIFNPLNYLQAQQQGFYKYSKWLNGYPAATTISVAEESVMTDLAAIRTRSRELKIISIKPPLDQWSNGDTPLHETAKIILNGGKGIMYLSGSSYSIQDHAEFSNIKGQTLKILEYIKYILSAEAMADAGVYCKAIPKTIRVYLKDKIFYKPVQQIIAEHFGDIAIVYLVADLHKNGQLIEVEGTADIEL